MTRSAVPARLLKTVTRLFPIERGKFRILNEIYFKLLSPQSQCFIVSTLRYGIKMRLDISEFLQAHLYLFGSYELPTVRFIRSIMRSGDVAIDVGAQIGYLTLAMATSSNGNVRVISFEPEATNIQRLKTNLSLNPGLDVAIVEKAASNVNGMLRLFLSHDHNSGTHSTIPNGVNVSSDFVEIPSVTLDTYVAQNGISSIRLIKIDVEGGELEVIQGAAGLLQKHRPILVMEMSDALQAARGFSTPEFKKLLADQNYSSFTISANGMLVTSSLNATHTMDNVVFIHSDHLDEMTPFIVNSQRA